MLQVILSVVVALSLSLASPVFAKELKPEPKQQASEFVNKQVVNATANASENKLRINQASQEEIAKMFKGVGLAKAAAIVEFRKANGPFKSAQELSQVKGIGAKTIDRNQSILIFD